MTIFWRDFRIFHHFQLILFNKMFSLPVVCWIYQLISINFVKWNIWKLFLTDHLFHWFWLIEFSTTEISCISQQIVSCFCWTHHLFQLMLMSWFNFFPLQRSAVYPNKLLFFCCWTDHIFQLMLMSWFNLFSTSEISCISRQEPPLPMATLAVFSTTNIK